MIETVELFPTEKPQQFKYASAVQAGRCILRFKLFDKQGKSISLVDDNIVKQGDADNTDPSEFEDGRTPSETRPHNITPRLVYKIDLYETYKSTCVIGKVIDAECGIVEFKLEPKHLPVSGIYYAQIQIGANLSEIPLAYYIQTAGADGGIGDTQEAEIIYSVYPAYIEVTPNLALARAQTPLTISEVRLHMRDADPSQNLLLEDFEFSDLEIINAIKKPIDLWNDLLPPIAYHTVTDFPFRMNWLDATVGYLLLTAAHRNRRNRLAYSAGGLSIDLGHETPEYQQIGRELVDRFTMWAQERKIAINMSQGFMSMGGIGY